MIHQSGLGVGTPCGETGVPPAQGSGRAVTAEAREQVNSTLDVVANGANLVESFSCWVSQFPIHVALPWVDGTSIATTHGDNHVGIDRHLVGEFLWSVIRDIDPLLLQCLDHRWIEGFAWSGAC